jgi:hypothetical protein
MFPYPYARPRRGVPLMPRMRLARPARAAA